MTKNDYIIPEQCRKCGTVFDLSYDLSEEDPYIVEVRGRIGKKLSESLCWACKKEMVVALSQNDEQEESEEDLSEDSILDDELD